MVLLVWYFGIMKKGGLKMYYYSKNSRRKIVHSECCHFRRIMNPETTGYFKTLAEAYSAGYRLCAHCDILSKHYRKEEQDLQEYCRNNGLSVHLGKRGIWVRSPRSEWRIIADDNRAGSKLYHKNDLHPGHRSYDLLTSYHDQKVSYSKLLKYLDYIVEHDYYRMLNPIYPAQHKAPPVKGTKRYRKHLKQQKKKARKDAVSNVLTLIESLSAPQRKTITA